MGFEKGCPGGGFLESESAPDGAYKLAQLVRACRGLYETTRAYRTPLVSGKDSMKNDAVMDGVKISVPLTLLVSAIGQIDDVRRAITLEPVAVDDVVFLLGVTRDETGCIVIIGTFSQSQSKRPIWRWQVLPSQGCDRNGFGRHEKQACRQAPGSIAPRMRLARSDLAHRSGIHVFPACVGYLSCVLRGQAPCVIFRALEYSRVTRAECACPGAFVLVPGLRETILLQFVGHRPVLQSKPAEPGQLY